MCGIVGLYTKNPAFEHRLGEYLSSMLIEMTERGPDSAGIAVYRNPAPKGATKLTLHHSDPGFEWAQLAAGLESELGRKAKVEVRGSHAVMVADTDYAAIRAWLDRNQPEVSVVSVGDKIEIYKEMGLPADVVKRFHLRDLKGTHALGHTRMATESAVTTQHSHPFSTGLDLCLVHNGSLSNHNRLRERLKKHGIEIRTDNDTEVAAGYLTWRLREGASLDEALEAAVKDLDGFYTFAVGTKDGFAVLRDPIACKHAVLAETDDWVAMATEYRSIATLPGADEAVIWEPVPAQIYSWSRA
jgi:methylamine---glutamate N-methyltransferase subunit A